MLDELTKDWEWLSFLAQYCAGKNISAAFCRDVKWWALGLAALVAAIVVWWICGGSQGHSRTGDPAGCMRRSPIPRP